MGWFGFGKSKAAKAPETKSQIMEIPLFPLNTVLFPGSVLGLKIFEQRYLDMVTAALREHSHFGICLIVKGGEVGDAAEPHTIGTLASIDQADMEQLGILLTTCRGGQRFRILERRVEASGLQTATVELLPEPVGTLVPPERAGLLPLLRKIVSDVGPERMPEPHAFDDAAWVSYRLTEVLPIQNLAKQKLLELDSPLVRLEILEKYLSQRGLLSNTP